MRMPWTAVAACSWRILSMNTDFFASLIVTPDLANALASAGLAWIRSLLNLFPISRIIAPIFPKFTD